MSTPNTSIKAVPNKGRRKYFEDAGLLKLAEALDNDLALRKLLFHRLTEIFGGVNEPPGTTQSATMHAKTLTTTSLILSPGKESRDTLTAMITASNPNPFSEFLRTHLAIAGKLEEANKGVSRTFEKSVEKARQLGLIQGSVVFESCAASGHSHYSFSERRAGACPVCSGPTMAVEFLKVDPLFFRAWDTGVLLEVWLYTVMKRAGVDVEPSLLLLSEKAQLAELDLVVRSKTQGRIVLEASWNLGEPSNDCKRALGNAKLLGQDCRALVVSSGPVAQAYKGAYAGLVSILDNAGGDPDFGAKLLRAVE